MNEEVNSADGVYVHVPFCDGKCGYCAFYSIQYEPTLAERFLAALEREFERKQLQPQTIYIGGGTPTILSAPQLKRLLGIIAKNISAERLVEWTIEANPSSLNQEKLRLLAGAGVNRLSLGAQSFDNTSLMLLGRRHKAEDIVSSAKIIREAGIRNLNIDLIACIPGLKMEGWASTVRQAIALEPEHVSVYALTPEEGTRLQRAALSGEISLLSDEEQLLMLDTAERLLIDGLPRYEISNYAKPGFECKHNLSCWRGGEYAGFGPAAASHAGLSREVNKPDLHEYIKAIEAGRRPPEEREQLTPDLKRKEMLIFGLRITEGVDAELAAWRRPALEALEREGLVLLQNNKWTLTPKGRNLADHVGSELI